MIFQSLVIFIEYIFILDPTNIAYHVLQTHMPLKLILIKEIHFTEPTIGMHEYDVAEIIDVSPFHMFIELCNCV